MPVYAYRGLNPSGKEIKSSVMTESVGQAKIKLRNDGIMLIDIREQKVKQKAGGDTGFSMGFSGRISVNDLALMTRQFSTLIRAKIQVVQALEALQDQVENETLKLVLAELKQKVNEGSSLSKALAEYPKIFDSVYINMVDAGESSGTLDMVLLKLADFTEARVRLKNKIRGAMMYPTIMTIIGMILISVVFTVVIPKITKIFVNTKKKIPIQTEMAIWISEFLKNYWWACLIGLVAIYWLFKKWSRSEKGMRHWHLILLKLPVIGGIVIMINIGRFCSTLATLLNAGVPILICMKIVKNLIPNVILKQSIEEAREDISEGRSMVGPLKESGHFPPMVTHMLSLGENSGELCPMLKIVAENYEDQVNTRLDGLTSVLEPIMIVVMGLVVGFVVFAVVIPMLELNKLG
ncbi:MAG: type II secretion system inner membrane protein GspF [Bacteriovoracales bacterium]|nr:type II secretion system inner membrane protein GspF [Bacteriovoracales bacterium]